MSDDLPTIAPYVSHSPEAEAASLPAQDHGSPEDVEIKRTENRIAELRNKKSPHPDLPSDLQIKQAETDRELAAIYDKAQATDPLGMPAIIAETSTDPDKATYEWNFETSDADKKSSVALAERLDFQRKEAKKFGLTLDQYQREMQELKAAQPAASDVLEPVRTMYPKEKPEAVIQHWASIDKFAQRDPVGAVAWIAEQLGVNPAAVQQHQTQREPAVNAAQTFFAAYPEAKPLHKAMADAINGGLVTGYTPGDHFSLYQKAYEAVRSENTKKKKGDTAKSWRRSIEDEMEETYDRMQA